MRLYSILNTLDKGFPNANSNTEIILFYAEFTTFLCCIILDTLSLGSFNDITYVQGACRDKTRHLAQNTAFKDRVRRLA